MGSVEAFAISLFGSSLEVFARFVVRFASVREVVILVLIVEVFLLPSLWLIALIFPNFSTSHP